MSLRRIMGTETEYGITEVGQPQANPMLSSTRVVRSYGATLSTHNRTRWDFAAESPLHDARGGQLPRELADPSQLTDENVGFANVVLPNGARWYVDHAHPEYSTPECTNPLDVVRWDKAGDMVAQAAMQLSRNPGQPDIVLYKNNTDSKGSSYGSHENYLMQRTTPFRHIVAQLIPFFVSRQVVCGAGRVGVGQHGEASGFQISQRADFIEAEVGLETTFKRPIINTRDEPHADPQRYRRLHVIVGDANLAEVSLFLKVGTTALVLELLENDALAPPIQLLDPVVAMQQVSHDPSLRQTVTCADGSRLTAVHIQWSYFEQVAKFLADRYGSDLDPITQQVLALWEQVLTELELDPTVLADRLDWVAKLQLVRAYQDRDGLAWDDPRLQMIDLQYSDLRPERGLFYRLVQRGRMHTLVPEAEIRAAVTQPPADTRAFFRGRVVDKFGPAVAGASWDSIILDVPGRSSLVRIPTPDPYRGTAAHVNSLIEASLDVNEFVTTLTQP